MVQKSALSAPPFISSFHNIGISQIIKVYDINNSHRFRLAYDFNKIL